MKKIRKLSLKISFYFKIMIFYFLLIQQIMCLAQSLIMDVGVDLGGGDRGMTQEHLDRPNVSPFFQQSSGETMPEGMRSYPLRHSCQECIVLDEAFYRFSGQMSGLALSVV